MKLAIIAAAIASMAVAFAAPAHAGPLPRAGQCTDKTNPQSHNICMGMANGQCGGIGMFGVSHSTCTYPDGSRDECDWHITSLTTATGACRWFPDSPPFPIAPAPPPAG
jgi:hypothetical protein